MKKIMLFFAVATILAACNNDNEVLNETQYITEFKADFGADTRMTATPDNGLKFAWEPDEVLYVYQADAPSVLYKEYKYDASTKTFKADTEEDKLAAGTKYFAVNQISDFAIVNDQIQFNARLDNTKDVTKIPLISGVFTATTEGTITVMHHTVGVVEVPVKLAAGSAYSTLENLGFYVSGGKVTDDFIATPGSSYFVEPNPGYDTSWAKQTKTLNESTTVSFFVPMFPGTYTNPVLNYNYNSKSTSINLTGTLIVERGEVTLMPVQTLTLN